LQQLQALGLLKRLKSVYRSDQLDEIETVKQTICTELDQLRGEYSAQQPAGVTS
jgi:hypothetical protein